MNLDSPVDCKESQPVHPKGDQFWVFIGRTDDDAETPILWPPHAKNWLIWKDPDAGKDWGQEKRVTENEMAGWHHRLNGHAFGWTPRVGDGQGGVACCGSWGRKESDTTERLNWAEQQQQSVQIPGRKSRRRRHTTAQGHDPVTLELLHLRAHFTWQEVSRNHRLSCHSGKK